MRRAPAMLLAALSLAAVASCIVQELTINKTVVVEDDGAAGAGGGGGAGGEAPTCGSLLSDKWGQSCQQCVTEADCCAEHTACATNTACRDLAQCHNDTFGPQAQSACELLHSVGGDTYASLQRCLQTKCSDECYGGDNWRCVESYSTPVSVTNQGLVALRVHSFPERAPVAAATTRACDSVTCAMPLDQVMSNDDGAAIFQLDLTFGGYFLSDGGGIMPPLRLYDAPLWREEQRFVNPPSTDGWNNLAAFLQVSIDPNLGLIVVFVRDCLDQSAPRVKYELFQTGMTGPLPNEPIYFDMVQPVAGQPHTAKDGLVVFLNVPVVGLTLSGTFSDSDEQVTRHNIAIDPGGVTMVVAQPKPVD